MFTDASDTYRGAVVTQIPLTDLGLPLEQQHHRPLAFLSGSFTGPSNRWPIVDKETYAIMATCKILMLLRPRGFHIFTDHRKLQYIFAPLAVNSTMSKFQADRLQRWAMTLTTFRYVIEHIKCEENVWGDLLSRWDSASTLTARMKSILVVDRVSPLQESDFVWLTHILRSLRSNLMKLSAENCQRFTQMTSLVCMLQQLIGVSASKIMCDCSRRSDGAQR